MLAEPPAKSPLRHTGTARHYIGYFKLWAPAGTNIADNWLFGISPEGIGVIGMLLNFGVAITVAKFTAAPPPEVAKLVDNIRVPKQS